ncbi:MAG: DM13 domain-containing protein [Chitinophagaceae bacterium]|jgi:hypothetical protein|nr:DM13 domain-containing protein [Chitinophagaceae bacterium]
MKHILFFFLLVLTIFNSCKKSPETTLNELIIDSTAKVKFEGPFMSEQWGTVSGLAKIYLKNGKYILALENFSTSNGPDLKVYLSKDKTPSAFIKLSNLKSTNGNQLYDIPDNMLDFSQYKYALIHCERFNHLFGSALLQ